MYKEEGSQLDIFSRNLKWNMQKKGISQNGLAKKLGCSVPTVNSWCQGQTMPRRDLFDKLCQFLNVSRFDLLSDRETIMNLSVPAAHPLMMLGRICAGDGFLADESFEGMFFVDNSIRADFCLRVEGDSMRDANIFHGDIAFLKKNVDILDGNIYAVVLKEDNYATLKHVYRQDGKYVLTPSNPSYRSITVEEEDLLIVGECVGVYHPR